MAGFPHPPRLPWALLALTAACPAPEEPSGDGDPCAGTWPTWYADGDGDGWGDPDVPVSACEPPTGTVSNADDCDDKDATVFPGATETCDGRDEDCDGEVDEDLLATWYPDQDGDGWGDDAQGAQNCDPTSGWVSTGGDCDDTDPTVHPGAVETCDGVDRDCDGEAPEDTLSTWYPDGDFDGWGDGSAGEESCEPPEGWVSNGDDCDDTSAATYPGAPDLCDGEDNDCDGGVDEDHKPGWVLVTVETDAVYQVEPSTGLASVYTPIEDGVDVSSTDTREDGCAMASRGHSDEIYTLDHCSGTETLVGETGEQRVGGLAFGPGGALYGLTQVDDELVTIDTATGAATPVGSVGFDLQNHGLAWDCSRNVLWGMDAVRGLFRVDLATGVASGFLPVPIDFEVVGLEYDAARQLLLAANGPSLYEIDPTTGAASRVGDFRTLDAVNDLAFMPPCP